MNEKLNIKDFDILGVITLNDVQGIEKYVTPIIIDGKKEEYLSRSKEYYNVKTVTELALERENLKTKLTSELTKKNFVILENILNCSGKVYFKKFEQYILKNKDEKFFQQLEQARKCLDEDVANIMKFFQNSNNINIYSNNILPTGDENSAKRCIEMDNKAMLYIFSKALKITKPANEVEILTPGYGSIYIGPMLKAMYGYEYTNLFKSKYIQETMDSKEYSIKSLMTSDRSLNKDKTVILLDDNVGTGSTIEEIKNQLNKEGKNDIITGAVQYNWRNYYRVSVGEKKDIQRFKLENFDLITPINYAGHNLYKHAIDTLHSSGEEYIKYLQSKSYRLKNISDLEGALERAFLCSRAVGLELNEEYDVLLNEKYSDKQILEQYETGPAEVKNPISRKMIREIINELSKIKDKEKEDEITIK